MAASPAAAGSPHSDISSFDDVYAEAAILVDGTAAGAQDQAIPDAKPNGTADEAMPAADSAVVTDEQAVDGAGDATAVSAPHADVSGPDAAAPPNGAHDSSSSSDSSDSSSSEDDSEEDVPLLSAAEQAKILMAEAMDDVEEPPPALQFTKPDVTVTPDMAITQVGTVEKVVELTVVVRANTSGSYRVLDVGSVLCLQDKTVLGSVFDIVGRVHEPAYTFGFPTEQDLKDSGVAVGTPVYYVDAHATYVFTQPLQLAKGTDANGDDGSDAEIVFSDDEKEAAHKRSLKHGRSHDAPVPDGPAGGIVPPSGPARNRGGRKNKRQRLEAQGNDRNNAPRGNGPAHGRNSSGDGEAAFADGYQPLRRPDNLTDLMQRGPQPGIERGPQANLRRTRGGRREKKRERREAEAVRRGPNMPGRFDGPGQGQGQGARGYGHEDGHGGRGGRDGYRRQDVQDQRSSYGNSATAQPFPSSPASASAAAQTNTAEEQGRYRQGQYSSYSNSSSNQSRPYVQGGHPQNYSGQNQGSQSHSGQSSGYGQQTYHDGRPAPSSNQAYGQWQNRGANPPANDYKPSYSANNDYKPAYNMSTASSHSVPAPSAPASQPVAAALPFALNPNALAVFTALQQVQAQAQAAQAQSQAAWNPAQAPQVQPAQPRQPAQGGTPGSTTTQDITSILERLKQAGDQYRGGYR
jgi:H/ACA ribonucleoprotein complex non-core subunit NAF1